MRVGKSRSASRSSTLSLRSHRSVEVERVVLAVLEALEAVDHQGLYQRTLGTVTLVKEQAVAAKTLHLAQHRGGSDPHLPGDLAVPGAGQHPQQQIRKHLRSLQPVGGMEGL
jgi:hypothetical protein